MFSINILPTTTYLTGDQHVSVAAVQTLFRFIYTHVLLRGPDITRRS